MIFKGRHAGATRLERDDGIRHGVAQQAMQVGAMRREVGSVELLARKPFQRLAIAQACRIPGDRHNCRRLECETLQGILEPEGAQYFDPIWTDLEASADFTEIGRALVDRNLNPKLAQRACGGDAANPGANHGDARFSLHEDGPRIAFMGFPDAITRSLTLDSALHARSTGDNARRRLSTFDA